MKHIQIVLEYTGFKSADCVRMVDILSYVIWGLINNGTILSTPLKFEYVYKIFSSASRFELYRASDRYGNYVFKIWDD